MARNNNTAIVFIIIALGVMAATGLYFFPGILQPGCTLCGYEWVSVGRATDVPLNGVINIGTAVANYNNLIIQSGKTVQGAEGYSQCQFSIYKIARYKQISTNEYHYMIWRNAQESYDDIAGSSGSSGQGFYYNCPNNYMVILDPTPKSCSPVTNPDPNSYSEYTTCTGIAGADIYIRASSVINTECTTGQVTSASCYDGSTITTKNCVNNQWVATGNKCPVAPSTPPSGTTPPSNGTTPPTQSYCTNTCPSNSTRGAYPQCLCVSNPQASVCTPNQVQTAICNGQNITTYSCVGGQWSLVQTCQSTVQNESSGTTILPPSNQTSNTGLIIIIGIIFIILVGLVIGAGYLFAKRR